MAGSVATREDTATVTFRDVFAEGEYRALWLAQLLSIAGDQFARVALAVLVYDRTGSAALAAVTFAVTTGAMFIGGLTLGWIADRYPRRRVMICCDLICLVLVLAMTVPRLPLTALVGLLFAVSLAIEPFLASRSATNRAVLGKDRFSLGNGITMATYQVAQLAGFSLGGIVAAVAGTRTALLIDAGTFAASAVIIRLGVKARRPKWQEDGAAPPGAARPEIWAGFRLVFASPVASTAMLLMWLAAFLAAPEGIAAPLSRELGGGTEGVGWLLAAMTAGAAAGPLLYNRFVRPAPRKRLVAVMAVEGCAFLILFAVPHLGLAGALIILATSGVFTGYLSAAAGYIFDVIPDERRGQVGGVVGAGMSLGQGTGVVVAGLACAVATPSDVIAVCGAAGTVIAVILAVRWRAVTRGGNPT